MSIPGNHWQPSSRSREAAEAAPGSFLTGQTSRGASVSGLPQQLQPRLALRTRPLRMAWRPGTPQPGPGCAQGAGRARRRPGRCSAPAGPRPSADPCPPGRLSRGLGPAPAALTVQVVLQVHPRRHLEPHTRALPAGSRGARPPEAALPGCEAASARLPRHFRPARAAISGSAELFRAVLVEGCQDSRGTGASLLRGKAERAGPLQSERLRWMRGDHIHVYK